ncbi:hypothetical protein [Nonomuraea turcica]|uniref:hypothetical protein n=1 Tax=Nonomuraea sp. G32 TaxID=3067274 RepID=UPI00273B46F7|nr:hypothetical protein [Nonomuraea sp. G32]MDP4500799.1 hypothetical protein [Nonomuraea sp. G32]
MTETTGTERMPAAVKTARFIMTLDVAFGLVGLAFPLVAFTATFDVIVLLLLAYSTAVTALTGWVLARWPTRRRRLVWTAVALEIFLLTQRLVLLVVDSDLTWLRILHPNTFFPVTVAIALLLPASRRWFNR